jgi:hypothetical protein
MAANPKCRLMEMGEAISTAYQNDSDLAAFSSKKALDPKVILMENQHDIRCTYGKYA